MFLPDHKETVQSEDPKKTKSKFQFLEWLFPFVRWWKKIKLDDVFRDLQAGVTVGALLIPQSMSYATLAYLPPQFGLYTGFIPPLIFAFFTTSYHISIGPVAPICILVGNALIKVVGPDSVDQETG